MWLKTAKLQEFSLFAFVKNQYKSNFEQQTVYLLVPQKCFFFEQSQSIYMYKTIFGVILLFKDLF